MIDFVPRFICNEFYISCQINRFSDKNGISSLESAYYILLYLKHLLRFPAHEMKCLQLFGEVIN
jgi:hypothetical protein